VTVRRSLKTATVLDELALLKQAYGQPHKIGKVAMQNGFGAVFSLYEAWWLRPDGTLIHASEDPPTDSDRSLIVWFESAAYRQEREKERKNRPNPYTEKKP